MEILVVHFKEGEAAWEASFVVPGDPDILDTRVVLILLFYSLLVGPGAEATDEKGHEI